MYDHAIRYQFFFVCMSIVESLSLLYVNGNKHPVPVPPSSYLIHMNYSTLAQPVVGNRDVRVVGTAVIARAHLLKFIFP